MDKYGNVQLRTERVYCADETWTVGTALPGSEPWL